MWVEFNGSINFFAPYAHIHLSFKEEDYEVYSRQYEEYGWPKHLFDLEDRGCGKTFARTYNAIDQILVFVISKLVKKNICFFQIFVPDINSDVVELMPGVRMKGYVCFLPHKFVSRARARNPFFFVRENQLKLNKFSFSFRPFQIKDSVLQWEFSNVTNQMVVTGPNQGLEEVKEGTAMQDVDPSVDQRIQNLLPNGCTVVREAPEDASVENGAMLESCVFFKFYEGWFRLHLIEFIPFRERSPSRPFQYVTLLLDDKEPDAQPYCIEFDLEKYSWAWDGEPGSWFIVHAL